MLTELRILKPGRMPDFSGDRILWMTTDQFEACFDRVKQSGLPGYIKAGFELAYGRAPKGNFFTSRELNPLIERSGNAASLVKEMSGVFVQARDVKQMAKYPGLWTDLKLNRTNC